MRVGFYQFDSTVRRSRQRNLDAVADALEQAEADLIVLPELFASGYQFVSQQEVITLSESVPDGPTTRRLGRACKAAPNGDCRRSSGARRGCLL